MTYCLAVLVESGLLMASDSRTNAGVDQIATVCKMDSFENGSSHFITVLSGGNLATTQAVIANLRQTFGSGTLGSDLLTAGSMFDATQIVADTYRAVLVRDGDSVRPFGDPTASFLVGGQIVGQGARLFEIYAAGNFIEAGPRTPFLQIGETKYGKPILDRALSYQTDLVEASKLALVSFDATMRSNLSVAPPIDVLLYQNDRFTASSRYSFDAGDPYLTSLGETYSEQLLNVVHALAEPPLTL